MNDAMGPAASLPDVVLYSRPGCWLCDEARANVIALLAQRESAGRPVPRFIERDITTNPDWEHAFSLTIPVVELGDRRVELATSVAAVRALLANVLDGTARAG